MGKIVHKQKKKKGRPSLFDIQKRNLKQQEEELKKKQQQKHLKRTHKKFRNPNPNPLRRSTRRNPNSNHHTFLDSAATNGGAKGEENDEQSARKLRETNLNLVPNANSALSDLNVDDQSSAAANRKRRKVESIGDGSGEKAASTNQAHSYQEVELDGPSTPLPNKKLLLFILDGLQRKDTYGVFAEPVDPEELPDYCKVIEHPMDFSTIRKNLTDGVYNNLKQFERDVFLLCSNAMQYNAPDTIYFRQARSMQELAKKNFENLRHDSDNNEPETKVVRRGRPPTKNPKKPLGKPAVEPAISDCPETTNASWRQSYNSSDLDVRETPNLDKYGSADAIARFSYGACHRDVYFSWSAEKYDADRITGSMSEGVLVKHGKKQFIFDENRRNTYNLPGPSATGQDPSVLMTFCGEPKQLVPVGLHVQYGYARSITRFASKLGPIAWKIAAKKIERCLPAGVEFSPSWFGENKVKIIRSLHPASSHTKTEDTESNTDKLSENRKVGDPAYHLQVLPGHRSLENLPSAATLPISGNAIDSRPSPVTSCSLGPTMGAVGMSQPAGITGTGPKIPAQKSSLIQPHDNWISGFAISSQRGGLLGPARSISGFKFDSDLVVPTPSETESSRVCSLIAEKNDLAGMQSTEKCITTQHDGSSLPASNLNKEPSLVGSEFRSDKRNDSTPTDLNMDFQSPRSAGSEQTIDPGRSLQL